MPAFNQVDTHAWRKSYGRRASGESNSFSVRAVNRELCQHYRTKTSALARAQASGHLDPSLETRQVVFAILSLINWQMSATQVTRMLFESDEETPPPTIEERRAFVVEMTRRMITRPGSIEQLHEMINRSARRSR